MIERGQSAPRPACGEGVTPAKTSAMHFPMNRAVATYWYFSFRTPLADGGFGAA